MKGEKQMKKFFSKYKVKILLIIFFTLLLVLLNNNVFATDDIISYTDRFGKTSSIVNCPLDTQYGFLIRDGYMFVLMDENSYFYMTSWGGSSSSLFVSGSCKCLVLSNNNTVIDRIGDQGTGRFAVLSEVKYTSVDIYNGTDKSSVALTGSTNFFPVAPEEIPEATTLLEVLEQEQEKKAIMKEVVGLLPVILSVLVSLIALRKALRILFNFLRTS